MSESNCKGCGKPIVWAKTKAGKNVPLDPRAPVYELKKDFAGERYADLTDDAFFVSHFSTCSQANQFSSSNRRSNG